MRVNPWVPFGGALAYNLHCHKHGWPTLCSTARVVVPAAAMALGWGFLTGWIIPHYADGFTKREAS